MYYKIAALNRFGGESEATEKPIRAVTKAEPLPPIGLEASAANLGRIDLHWAPNVEPDLASYEIWRSSATEGAFATEIEIASVPAGTTTFADAAIGCGQSARYRLRATDADDLVSTYSDPLEVKGQDAGLAATRRDGTLVIAWQPARATDWTAVRVSEVRGALPDRELAKVSGASEVSLQEVDPGTPLAITFQRTADGAIVESPPCRLITP
ncbi:MAG: hypothetical protein ACREBE_12430, partial [bacterium]